jgi:hypothetical protein
LPNSVHVKQLKGKQRNFVPAAGMSRSLLK